jgi:hypothetical protein
MSERACRHLAFRGEMCADCGVNVFDLQRSARANEGENHYAPESGLERLAAREAMKPIAMDGRESNDWRGAFAPAPKPRPDLLPAGALLAAGAAMAGRTDRDEQDQPGFYGIPAHKYRASLLRHVLAYMAGECVDPDSGLSALAHVISNAAILWEKDRLGKSKDESE